MVLRSQRDGWAAPGTQTPYKRDHRDHRRTRSRAARWNAGTWPVADRGEVWVCGARLPASKLAEGAWVAFDDALEPPTAACWREGGWVWSEVDSSMTLQALLGPRDRDNRFPLPKQFPLSLGCPSRGLSLLRLPPVDGGQDGRGGLPTPSSTAPLLEAAAAAVREQGWMQGAALGDEQAGRCNRRTGRAAAVRRGRKC